LKKVITATLVLLAAFMLSGCTAETWSFCVNDIYASEYASPWDGVKLVSSKGEWVIVDVSITNMTKRSQLLGEDTYQFYLVDVEYQVAYPNSEIQETDYGIQWRIPVPPGETVRGELYFETEVSFLEVTTVGLVMYEGKYVEPEAIISGAYTNSATGLPAGPGEVSR